MGKTPENTGGESNPGSPSADNDPDAVENARALPNTMVRVPGSKTYPAFFGMEKQMDASGNPTGIQKLVGYIYLNTFEPQGEEDDVVAEVKASLHTLVDDIGVHDIVIDLMDNTGGSLTLGMRIAQLFSNQKVVMPDMELKLSDSWLDQFQQGSLDGTLSDNERMMDRTIYGELKEDKAAGLSVSRKINISTLVPFELAPNDDVDSKLNIALMTNEMCASMCDIFTAIMKDNGLATTVGAQTMGAGGNVVTHFQAPNSHFIIRQTESLIVRTTGDYLENNGVKADVPVDVNKSVSDKYETVRQKAIGYLLGSKN